MKDTLSSQLWKKIEDLANSSKLIPPPQAINGALQQVINILNPAVLGARLQSGIQNYQKQVQANKQTPFFNPNNTPTQWIGKVGQDIQKRGIFEGAQDLTYPVLMNPYIEPVTEPITSNLRMMNYKANRPFPFINSLLGQTDSQMAGSAQPPSNTLTDYIRAKTMRNQQNINQNYNAYIRPFVDLTTKQSGVPQYAQGNWYSAIFKPGSQNITTPAISKLQTYFDSAMNKLFPTIK